MNLCSLSATALGLTATVVRYRGDVLDRGDLDARLLDRADGGVAARTRALDLNFGALETMLHGRAAGLLGGELGGERGALAAALVADGAGRRPSDDVALGVGDRDDRVVERALDVHHTGAHVLAVALARTTRGGGLGHYFLTAFFLLATVRFGPLRVRALVWVRWPRTGRPLRWRMPWRHPISILRLMSCCTSRRRSPSTVSWSTSTRMRLTSSSVRLRTRVL